jgi:predicted nucleic acid-binding protein
MWQTKAPVRMCANGWSESVYLDLDVILAELKESDWLASEVDLDSIADPKTSVATGIELQYVMEDEWERDRVVRAHQEIVDCGISVVPLDSDALDAAADLRSQYDSLNVFDGVHLGTAHTLGEPIVSTDTLFPQIPEIEHVDPRDLD